ncbi:MAG: hypothetical protein EB059_03080 [Alphaproteobacteria bacterium]|nr:hypothetical protein [Alphaproteobacteria bacterium]
MIINVSGYTASLLGTVLLNDTTGRTGPADTSKETVPLRELKGDVSLGIKKLLGDTDPLPEGSTTFKIACPKFIPITDPILKICLFSKHDWLTIYESI